MPADAVLFCRAKANYVHRLCFSLRGAEERRRTHARAGGHAFPAVWDIGLVGVVGVAQQGAGGRGAAAARGAGFTELDSAVFLYAAVRRGGLAPLWVGCSRSGVLTYCRKTNSGAALTQRRHLFSWHEDGLCLRRGDAHVTLTQGSDDIVSPPG